MEFVIFNKNNGSGIISDKGEKLPLLLNEFKLGNEILIPGQETTMEGWMTRPCKFMGQLNQEGPANLVFYLGCVEDIFGAKDYYEVFWWLSETRIFKLFTYNSGRDYNYKNGEWK